MHSYDHFSCSESYQLCFWDCQVSRSLSTLFSRIMSAVPRLLPSSCRIVYEQWEESLEALITCTRDVQCVVILECDLLEISQPY